MEMKGRNFIFHIFFSGSPEISLKNNLLFFPSASHF